MRTIKAPKIDTIKRFDADKLRALCIEECWFWYGEDADYTEMLDFARRAEYTPGNLYRIADEIAEFSDQEPGYKRTEWLEHIMFEVERNATITTFVIVEE